MFFCYRLYLNVFSMNRWLEDNERFLLLKRGDGERNVEGEF